MSTDSARTQAYEHHSEYVEAKTKEALEAWRNGHDIPMARALVDLEDYASVKTGRVDERLLRYELLTCFVQMTRLEVVAP